MCCNGLKILLMFSFTALSFVLNNFFPNIPVILWYIGSINVFTFLLFSIDKLQAIKTRKRVPENSLHFFSFAGGFLGAILAMILTRHKINKKNFLFTQALILIFWIAAIYFLNTNQDKIQGLLN